MTRRRWWLIGAGAALVVVAVGAAVLWQAASRTPTAEEAATAYLRALESGEPSEVQAVGIDVTDAALAAFAGATEFVEDAEVTALRDGGDGEATAEVVFRLGGEEHTTRLVLSTADGRWSVDTSALGAMTATATIGSFVSIGDATFPVDEKTALLPGAYAVTAAPSSLLGGDSALRVLPGETTEVAIDASLRPEATDAAQEQLAAHLETCTAPADAAPDGCGIRIPWGTEFRAVSEIRYRVEQQPAVTLTGTAFSAGGGVLVATVTGTGQDGSARTATYRTESWALRGDVVFTADGLELSAW